MSTPTQHPADVPEAWLLYLDPRVLLGHPLNIRHDIGDVTELAESLKTGGIGLVEPIVVVPVGAGYRMVGGHRRCTAAILAELPTVPCFERPRPGDSDPDQIAAMIAENAHRKNRTGDEEVHAYAQPEAFPEWTVERIARRTGRPTTVVRDAIATAHLRQSVSTSAHPSCCAAACTRSLSRPHTTCMTAATGRSKTRFTVRQACECAAPMKA
jgi:ParB family transcriptional regulator, chromosome partitioning protein